MSDPAPSKTHTGENFPVASAIIAKRHRGIILAFYRFARAGDDAADHGTRTPAERLALLGALGDTLTGRGTHPDALPLKAALAERGMGPQHPLDLLVAFRQDVTKRRYADWGELLDYCRYSAAPVGRFVLDVHGEAESTWPANDALCTALQIVNHLQDCGKDYREIDRVYLPADIMAQYGARVEALGGGAAPATLLGAIHATANRTADLVAAAAPLSAQTRDARLAIEIAIIHRLCAKLQHLLTWRDPLSERVHFGKAAMLRHAAIASMGALLGRGRRRAGMAAA